MFEAHREENEKRVQDKLSEAVSSMTDYNPDLQKLKVFGDPGLNWQTKQPMKHNQKYPKKDQVVDFPVFRRIKLCGVAYKLNSDKTPLMAIQLKFTNGIKTPLFQTSSALDIKKVQEAEIDFNKKIVKINLYLSTSSKIYAL